MYNLAGSKMIAKDLKNPAKYPIKINIESNQLNRNTKNLNQAMENYYKTLPVAIKKHLD